MNLQLWLKGCINSGLEQSAKLGLVILGAFTVGQRLDIATLAISCSVGWLFGVCQWVYFNPLSSVINNQPRLFTWLK